MDRNSTVAARGEGLAGLVAQHDPQLYSPSGPVSGVNGSYTIAFLGCSCGWNSTGEASKTEKWSEHVIAALEAAARLPGTPPDLKYKLKIAAQAAALEIGRRLDTSAPIWAGDVTEIIQGHMEAALATPSPQAPELSRHTCDWCGQDLRGAGFDGHYNIYCHKPECAAHLVIQKLV